MLFLSVHGPKTNFVSVPMSATFHPSNYFSKHVEIPVNDMKELKA